MGEQKRDKTKRNIKNKTKARKEKRTRKAANRKSWDQRILSGHLGPGW